MIPEILIGNNSRNYPRQIEAALNDPVRLNKGFMSPVPDLETAGGKIIRLESLTGDKVETFLSTAAQMCLTIHNHIQATQGPEYSMFSAHTLKGLIPEIKGESFSDHETKHIRKAEELHVDLSTSRMDFCFEEEPRTNLLLPVIRVTLPENLTPDQRIAISMAPDEPSYMDVLQAIVNVKYSGKPWREREELYSHIRQKTGMNFMTMLMWRMRVQTKTD